MTLAKWLTKYRRHPIPDSSDCQRTREDSNTSIENTAPDIAPTAAPRTNPLSVSCPIKAPVMAPNNVPTAYSTQIPYKIRMLDMGEDYAQNILSLYAN